MLPKPASGPLSCIVLSACLCPNPQGLKSISSSGSPPTLSRGHFPGNDVYYAEPGLPAVGNRHTKEECGNGKFPRHFGGHILSSLLPASNTIKTLMRKKSAVVFYLCVFISRFQTSPQWVWIGHGCLWHLPLAQCCPAPTSKHHRDDTTDLRSHRWCARCVGF